MAEVQVKNLELLLLSLKGMDIFIGKKKCFQYSYELNILEVNIQ